MEKTITCEQFEQLRVWWNTQPRCVYCNAPVAWNPKFIGDGKSHHYVGSWIHSDGNKSCKGIRGVAWPKGDLDTSGKPFWGYSILAQ